MCGLRVIPEPHGPVQTPPKVRRVGVLSKIYPLGEFGVNPRPPVKCSDD